MSVADISDRNREAKPRRLGFASDITLANSIIDHASEGPGSVISFALLLYPIKGREINRVSAIHA
jgi:hypothetical protein